MTRRLLNLVTALSLLVCVATVVMAVRSYFVGEQWNFAPRPAPPIAGAPGPWTQSWHVASEHGRLMFLNTKLPDPQGPGGRPSRAPGYEHRSSVSVPRGGNPFGYGTPKGERHVSVPGVEFFSRPAQVIPAPSPPLAGDQPGTYLGDATLTGWRYVGVSWWLLAAVASILPARWAWRWRRERRAKRLGQNLCVRCGYDLRGTPDRCPECGTIAPAPAL